MDGFACSSWYFLRFVSPHYADGPFDPAALAQWGRPDLYVGGAEHAVMHLLYARFWTKVHGRCRDRAVPRAVSRCCAARAPCMHAIR